MAAVERTHRNVKLCELIPLILKESWLSKRHICGNEEYTVLKGREEALYYQYKPWGMHKTLAHGESHFKLEFCEKRKKSKADSFKGFGAYMNQNIVYRIIVQPKYLHMGFIRTQPQISFTWP